MLQVASVAILGSDKDRPIRSKSANKPDNILVVA